MSRHYSSSGFVEWMREKVFDFKKPSALGWGEWAKWDAKLKSERSIAFFFTETLPDWAELIPKHSIDYVNDFRYYVVNRVHGSHRLDSTLKKGDYHEFSERMLYSMFDSLVNYIDSEEAHMHIVWADKAVRDKYNVPWWKRHWMFRWGQAWKCPEAAIDHLKWEMELTDSPIQAESAREKMSLYTWWKHIRPGRGRAWDVSGFQAHWDKMDAKYGDDWLGLGGKGKMSRAEDKAYRKLQKSNDELEEQWEKEDEDMIIRLVKLRKNLWT